MEGPEDLGARDGTSSNLSATTLGAGRGQVYAKGNGLIIWEFQFVLGWVCTF